MAERRPSFSYMSSRSQSGVALRFPPPSKVFGCNFAALRWLRQGGLGLAVLLFSCCVGLAQDSGSISGVVVSSWDGTPLPGATVSVRGTTLATQTDASGRFELKNVPPGDQVLRFSKSSYATAVVTDARVLPGQTTTVNGNLRPEFYEMEEYEVTAEEFVQQTEQIIFERQKSSSMMEALGSEQLSRLGAGNAAESIAKVSGATIVDGKSAVIRGLNDRYVTTSLNGASIPSADPYRQSAALDLFPSQVIDRVVVAKTFTPDQPGTYTGGGIDIVTKSFPEKPFLSVTLGTAYNTQASLNGEFLTYNGGSHDWAAMDDGTRALPEVFNTEAPIGSDPKTDPAIPAPVQGNVLTNSVNLANDVEVDQLTKALGPSEFAPHEANAPLNQNFAIAGGNTARLLGQPLGYFASGSYKHDFASYQDGISRRYQGGTLGVSELKNSYRDDRSLSTVNWSGMVTLSYEPIEHNELGFLFFYNQNSVDDSRIQKGIETYTPGAIYRKFNLFWTQRNLQTYQMTGKHDFESLGGLQFNWLVGLTKTSQDEPDARFFNDVDFGSGYTTENGTIPSPNKPTRYFRQLEENNRNIKLDWTLPFKNWTDTEGQFKFGAFNSYSERGFTERQIYYNQGFNGNSPGYYYNDPNQYLTDAQVYGSTFRTNVNGRTVNVRFNKFIQSYDSYYDGQNSIPAGYLMLDLPVVSTVRLVGGARYESTDLQVYSASYLDSSVTGTNINNAVLNQGDLLPSAGLIYAITPNMNLRLNYSQTIARPSYRELAAVYNYDPVISEYIEGNPLLKMSSIQNFDARWEWFPRPGELISFSVFYKELQNAIERGNVDTAGEVISYFNRDQASLYGVEVEARKNLEFLGSYWKPFSVGGNLSLIQSEVELTPDELSTKRAFFPDASATRPLYDQSPYILNLDLSFDNPHWGTSASVIFNVNGPRITVAKLNTEDVYEQPAPTLDFVLSQKIGKSLTVKFAAKNLLNPEFQRTYGENSDLLYSSYKKGMTFGLNLSYDF